MTVSQAKGLEVQLFRVQLLGYWLSWLCCVCVYCQGCFVNANCDGSHSCNGGYVCNAAVSPSGRCVNAFWLCCEIGRAHV